MKKSNLFLSLLAVLTLAACGKNKDPHEGYHLISLEENAYGTIYCSKDEAKKDETVYLNFVGRGSYAVEEYLVNGQPITGNSFTMPDGEVTVKANVYDPLANAACNFSAYGGGVIATSYWFFNYGEKGLEITVRVQDRIIVTDEYAAKEYSDDQDGVSFILSYDSEVQGFDLDTSYRIVATVDNKPHINKAETSTAFGEDMSTTEKRFYAKSTLKTIANGDGYDGYEINAFFNYNFFGIERADAVDLITIAPQMRNTNNYNASTQANYLGLDCNYKNANTHPYILEDGTLKSRKAR